MASPPDNPFTRPLPDDIWDKYWAHGFLTSCGEAFDENYEGEMRRVWEEFFGALGPGTAVLDIGTGNGAVPMIAAEVSESKNLNLQIHAIDLAQIKPQQAVTRQRHLLAKIHFHGNTPMEKTGFEPSAFDAITGQYALEYGDLEAAVLEIGRISKPNARLLFVCHHHDSVVLQTGREELRLSRALFEDIDLFGHAAA